MIEYTFIVLHYSEKSLKDTFECIESIINNLKEKNYSIVIIENGSNDSSYDELFRKYGRFENIDIVKSEENLGFARGNNLGYQYSKKKYNPDFLIVLNNDTLILQSNLLSMIKEEFQSNEFHILGPDIIDRYDYHQNPIRNRLIETIEDVELEIMSTMKNLSVLENNGISRRVFYKIIDTIKKNEYFVKLWRTFRRPNYDLNDYTHPQWGVPLHGSAMIFSRKYMEKFEGYIFYPKTFLYVEEDILNYIANRDGLKVRYLPNIIIKHKEDSSTNSIVNGKVEKAKFTNRHKLESLEVFRELIEEDTKNRKYLEKR